MNSANFALTEFSDVRKLAWCPSLYTTRSDRSRMHSLRAAWTPRKRVRPLPALPPTLGVATLPTLSTTGYKDAAP